MRYSHKSVFPSPLSNDFVLTSRCSSAYPCRGLIVRSMNASRPDSQNITTEQVANILGVSKRTLKTWLQNGKVSEPDRNPKNNYRIWTLADVDALRLILKVEK